MPFTVSPRPTFPLEYHLPGLEATQGLPNGGPVAYTTISFAAGREYADDEGWIKVRSGRRPARRTANRS
jgi:hypothetical protein